MKLSMKRSIIVEIISALFILLFFYTALSKSFEINNTVYVLERTPLFSSLAVPGAWTIVITEYIVAILLFFPRTKKAGLYGSLLLMGGFTLYIVYMMLVIPDLPCTCGGVISKMTWSQHLIFNIFFTLLALTGILLLRKKTYKKEEEMPQIVYT